HLSHLLPFPTRRSSDLYGSSDGSANDEALELEQKLPGVPHLQGPDRVAVTRVAVKDLAGQAILLDDGFQHRRLGRDLDIVLLDADRKSTRLNSSHQIIS